MLVIFQVVHLSAVRVSDSLCLRSAFSSYQIQNSDATDIASATDHTRPQIVTVFGICITLASLLCCRHYHIRGTFESNAPDICTVRAFADSPELTSLRNDSMRNTQFEICNKIYVVCRVRINERHCKMWAMCRRLASMHDTQYANALMYQSQKKKVMVILCKHACSDQTCHYCLDENTAPASQPTAQAD